MISNLTSVAIIGGGPAGFYLAKKLLNSFNLVRIDIFEKLKIPFGLVRYGVAPDHPEVRNVIKTFNEVLFNPRIRVFCGINVGQDICIKDIRNFYQAVVLTYGAYESKRLKKLNGVKNVFTGLEFVQWYNGFSTCNVPLLDRSNAVLIGIGNVALDGARMLLKDPFHFESIDMSSNVLESLKRSKIRNVVIAGRRGFGQATFKTKELRELLSLNNINFECVNLPVHQPNDDSSRQRRRQYAMLVEATKRETIEGRKKLKMNFLIELSDFKENNGRIVSIIFRKNRIVGNEYDEKAMIESLPNDYVEIPCDLLVMCMGQNVEHIDADIPYNSELKQVNHNNLRIEPGFYCAGWAAHGSKGTLADALVDARQVAKLLSIDLEHRLLNENNRISLLLDFLKTKKIKFHVYAKSSK